MNESREQDGHRQDADSRGSGESGRRMPGRSGRWRHGRGRRLPADVAEKLLNGDDTAGDAPGTAELAALLSAARVLPAGRPQDEADALHAFRAAIDADTVPTASVPFPVVPARRWGTTRGHRPVRILVAAAAALFAVGGAAFAAQGGGFPHPFHPGGTTHGPSASATYSSVSPTGTSPGASRDPGSAPGAGGSRTPSTSPSHRSGSASPSSGTPSDAGAKGRCEAYTQAEREGKTPDVALRSRLAKAAGGAARIDAYCATVVSGHNPRSTASHPGASTGPSPDATAASTGPSPAATAASAAPTPPAQVTPGVGRHK